MDKVGDNLMDNLVHMKGVFQQFTFRDRVLNVWEEVKDDKKRYFVTPICEFVPDTAKIRANKFSNNEHVIRFTIRLWSNEADEFIQQRLAEVGVEADLDRISPLPMKSLRIRVKQCSSYWTEQQWRTNITQPNEMTFDMYFVDEKTCQIMVERSYAYLDSDNTDRLSREIFRSIMAEELTSADYIASDDEKKFTELICQNFKDQPKQITALAKDEWESVFWDNIYARPDVELERFNEVFSHDAKTDRFIYHSDKDNQFRQKIQNKYSNSNSWDLSMGLKIPKIELPINLGYKESNSSYSDRMHEHETKNRTILTTDQLNAYLKQNKSTVRWSGQKFEFKNMDLYRLNFRELQDRGEFFYRRINLTTVDHTETIEICDGATRNEQQQADAFKKYKNELMIKTNQEMAKKDDLIEQLRKQITDLTEENEELKEAISEYESLESERDQLQSELEDLQSNYDIAIKKLKEMEEAMMKKKQKKSHGLFSSSQQEFFDRFDDDFEEMKQHFG